MNTSSHVDQSTDHVAPLVAGKLSRKELMGERLRILVDQLKKDVPVCEALSKAGWPPRQARKGWIAVPQRAVELLIEQGVKFERIGQHLVKAPSKMEYRIIGAMHERMVTGAKDGVNAAKLLSQHKSVSNQFVQDAAQNVLVIQAPNEWKPSAPDAKPHEPAKPGKVIERELPEYE